MALDMFSINSKLKILLHIFAHVFITSNMLTKSPKNAQFSIKLSLGSFLSIGLEGAEALSSHLV
jgi:hypothetical protein